MLVEILTVISILFASSLISYQSILVVRKLMNKGSTAMVKMQLNQESTISEFKQLLYFHLLIVPGFLLVLISGITESGLILNIGRAIIGIIGSGIMYVFYRWRRKF